MTLQNFYRNRRVLVTGHTGFKGGWLALWLYSLGAEVHGISLKAVTDPNLFDLSGLGQLVHHRLLDIRNSEMLREAVVSINPEIVFHLAAQPLVRQSYKDPLQTFSTNVMGTANLLEGLRHADALLSCVVVTTDKVYKNLEWPYPYRESDALGGHDPYSASKACAELVTASYRDSFMKQRVALATARAGNVIGGGDWSEDRLIPDAVRAWSKGGVLSIRSPHSVRPWQHVLEPVHSYLRLAMALCEKPSWAGAYNFGPSSSEAASVAHVIDMALKVYGQGSVEYTPDQTGLHEAGRLTLETSLADQMLGIKPRWTLEEAVARTMGWYREQLQGKSVLRLVQDDIEAFGCVL